MNADQRDLPDSIFIRMILAGAIARGGATIDNLLTAGQNVVSSNTMVQSRSRKDYTTLWQTKGRGIRFYKADPRWEIRKDNPCVKLKAKDPHYWWYLTGPGIDKKPLDFDTNTACQLATQIVEERLAEPPDIDCFTLPDGDCIAPWCRLHGPGL